MGPDIILILQQHSPHLNPFLAVSEKGLSDPGVGKFLPVPLSVAYAVSPEEVSHVYLLPKSISQPPSRPDDSERLGPRHDQSPIRWIRRFILFHRKRHPADLGVPEIEAFLTHLAVDLKVAPNAQIQALSALLYLSRSFLGQELPARLKPIKATGSLRLPTTVTSAEVQLQFDPMLGLPLRVAGLPYGALRAHRWSQCPYSVAWHQICEVDRVGRSAAS